MLHQHLENINTYRLIREYARQMRKNPTEAEKLFWEKVRHRRLFGLKINRQYIIECRLENGRKKYYIADFHCSFLKLIIELDGHIHLYQQDEDLIRSAHLENYGYTIIRFTNEQVLHHWEEVEAKIKELMARKNGKI